MNGGWQQWVGAILLGLVVWYFWRSRKAALQKADFSQSFKVMGILALLLIIFVGALVLLARQ